MKLTKEQLQQFLNNPGSFNPEEMQDEESLSPESMLEEVNPEAEDAELMAEAPAEPAFAVSPGVKQAADAAIPDKSIEYKSDPAMMEALRKLKSGQSLDEDVSEEMIDDAAVPMELRKAAIQKVRKKYLGE